MPGVYMYLGSWAEQMQQVFAVQMQAEILQYLIVSVLIFLMAMFAMIVTCTPVCIYSQFLRLDLDIETFSTLYSKSLS